MSWCPSLLPHLRQPSLHLWPHGCSSRKVNCSIENAGLVQGGSSRQPATIRKRTATGLPPLSGAPLTMCDKGKSPQWAAERRILNVSAHFAWKKRQQICDQTLIYDQNREWSSTGHNMIEYWQQENLEKKCGQICFFPLFSSPVLLAFLFCGNEN